MSAAELAARARTIAADTKAGRVYPRTNRPNTTRLELLAEVVAELAELNAAPAEVHGPTEGALTAAAVRLIAAKAWEEGYAASQLEWEHVMSHSGHTVEPDDPEQMCTTCGQGNPYERNALGASHD